MIPSRTVTLALVDDEPPVRQLVRKCQNWDELGITIEFESSDGAAAIDRLKSDSIDIVLTDICMPNIDGLDLAAYIKGAHPNTEIVLLTGHDEFEYAKRGIEIGIADFVLKPINDEELSVVLRTTAERVRNRRAEKEDRDALERYVTHSEKAAQERCLSTLLATGPIASVLQEAEFLRLPLYSSATEVALLTIAPSNATKGDMPRPSSITAVVRGHLGEREQTYLLSGPDYDLVIIAFSSNGSLESWCRALVDDIRTRTGRHAAVGIGVPASSPEEIRRSYLQARHILDRVGIGGENVVSVYRPHEHEGTELVEEYSPDPEACVSRSRTSRLIHSVQEFVDRNLGDPDLSLSSVAEHFHVSPSYLSRVFSKESQETFVGYVTRGRINRSAILLKNTDLLGYEIAERVGIPDAHYFSMCFKKYAGMSVTEYRKRIGNT